MRRLYNSGYCVIFRRMCISVFAELATINEDVVVVVWLTRIEEYIVVVKRVAVR